MCVVCAVRDVSEDVSWRVAGGEDGVGIRIGEAAGAKTLSDAMTPQSGEC